MQRFMWAALSLAALCACGEPGAGQDYGDPTALSLPTESAGITAWVASPDNATPDLGATPEIVLAAYVTDDEATPLDVRLSKLEASESGESQEVGTQRATVSGEGKAQRFSARIGLSHGDNRIRARIATRDLSRVRTMTFSLRYDGDAPGVTLTVSVPQDVEQADPCENSAPLTSMLTRLRSVCVRGQVTTAGDGSASASVSVAGADPQSVVIEADGRFAQALTLPQDKTSKVTLNATAAGVTTSATTEVTQDETPPTVRLDSGATETIAQSLGISGRIDDRNGISELAVESERGGRERLPVEGGNQMTFDHEVRLAVGDNPLVLVAVDAAGNESRTEFTLSRVRVLQLGAPRGDTGSVEIEADRQALDELLTEDDQKAIDLAAIDLEPAVRQALARIRDPERYGVDTSDWGAAEENLQRILRMTPDVADLSGTSVAELLDIASGVSLPAPRLLGDLLDMQPTDYIVDLDVAAAVIVDNLVGTHPNIARDDDGKPVLAISMWDVLQELRSVGPRFSAVEDHPGFLTGESRGDVLEPGFLLSFPVTSNLTQYDAIDLSRRAKDFLFLLEGDQVLDFNVLSDDFGVIGLVDEPTIDLRFALGESPLLARAGDQQDASPDPDDPGFFRGNGDGFAMEPYRFEHITAEIGYRQLHRNFAESFQRVNRYDAGSIQDAAVIAWDRGWLTITSAGGLGAPPPPLYAWDLLMEVAEVRLHDGGLAQGEGDMAFNLERLPIGLTADELIEKLRPKLNEQEAKLSEILIGTQALASSGADVFYSPGSEKNGVLFFRGEADGDPIDYPSRGFFSDPGLTDKVSTTEAAFGSEDTSHEKVSANPGAVYYAADEDGAAYELRVSEGSQGGIGVEVRSVGGAP